MDNTSEASIYSLIQMWISKSRIFAMFCLATADPIVEFFVRENDYEGSFNIVGFLSLLPLGVSPSWMFSSIQVCTGLPNSGRFLLGDTNVYFDAGTSPFWKALNLGDSSNRAVNSLLLLR
jgi:hypothetical protein